MNYAGINILTLGLLYAFKKKKRVSACCVISSTGLSNKRLVKDCSYRQPQRSTKQSFLSWSIELTHIHLSFFLCFPSLESVPQEMRLKSLIIWGMFFDFFFHFPSLEHTKELESIVLFLTMYDMFFHSKNSLRHYFVLGIGILRWIKTGSSLVV